MTEQPFDEAKALALRLLSHRARTEAQLRRRLAGAGFEAEAPEVVAWLLRLGYLDDAAFARAAASSLLAPGRLGPRAAERRLVAAGIEAEAARQAVAAALAEAGQGGGELALCRALAERRTHGVPPAELDERARARLARFLLGRGFAGAAVARVTGLWADAEPE